MPDLKMMMQDPAIQPPEALKVQLGEIYQFIYEDESLANRGCREVWSDLMQLGVKDSLIADFDTFNSMELKQTFDRSSCESILLDGFQKNKSFLEVAEALNSQCADSLELFVFHCFASAEANAFAVANVSGGTRSPRGVTATAKGLDHPEWNERESGLGDHLPSTMAHELPVMSDDPPVREAIRSDANQISTDLPRDISRDASPLIEYRRDTSGVGDPSSEGNPPQEILVATAESMKKEIKLISADLTVEYEAVTKEKSYEQAYELSKKYAERAIKLIDGAEELEKQLRLKARRLYQLAGRLGDDDAFPYKVDKLRSLLTDHDPVIRKAAKYVILADDADRILDAIGKSDIRIFLDETKQRFLDMEALKKIMDESIVTDEKDFEALKPVLDKNIGIILQSLDDFKKSPRWEKAELIDNVINKYIEFNTKMSNVLADLDLEGIEENVKDYLDFMKRVEYVIETEQDIADELEDITSDVNHEEQRIHDAISSLVERVDSAYVRFMVWWRDCWLCRTFTTYEY